MKVKYYNKSNEPVIIETMLNCEEYNDLKIGDYHILISYDIENYFEESKISMRMFLEKDLDKNNEYYNILKDLIYSDDKNNYLIALKIINQI